MKAFDGDGQHAQKRNRRAAVSGVTALLARIVQIGSTLFTVPLTLRYLGTERFGLWMTISSVLAMAAFADLGVGNGVLNAVAKAFGEDDVPAIRRAVSSGFAILVSLAACLVLTFFAIYAFVPWANVFRVYTPTARAEAGPALAVFAVCFALNIALDAVQRVQLGIQQGYRYGIWQTVGSFMGLLGVLLGIHFHVGLPVLVAALAGAPTVATLVNALHFFLLARPDLRPHLALVSRTVIRQIARLGVLFFVLQLAVAIAFSADNLIIARTLGAVRVPEYAIPQRMFALISMMSAMLLTPLWPAYGEASSRGDLAWIRRTLRRTFLGVFAGSATAALIILLLSHRLLALWVGGRVQPSFGLLLGLAVWSVVDCCGNAVAMYLNGTSVIRYQIYIASVFGISCVITKVFMARRFGITAVPWSTFATYMLFNALPLAVIIPRSLRRLERSAAPVSQPLPASAV